MPCFQMEMDEAKAKNVPKVIKKLVGNDWSVKVSLSDPLI